MCGTKLDIVVSQVRTRPQDVGDYVRSRHLGSSSVLVLVYPPMRLRDRFKWKRESVRRQLTLLPLDRVLVVHLCTESNRLSRLLEFGLPCTWSRPYITKGENVAREMFVGRHQEAAALIDPHGGCIVFGGRQLGKSVLLRHVKNEHHDPDAQRFVIYVDVNTLGLEPQTHEEMLTHFWRRVHDRLKLTGAIQGLTPVKLSRHRQLVDEVPRLIETRLAKDKDARIVLLLDESDALLDLDSGRNFTLVRRLRALMAEHDRRFKVVFAGLHSVQRYTRWGNHPFAQLGSELVVNPLPAPAAQDLIVRPMRALGFSFESPRLVHRILSLANYHPGLIQIICYRLMDNLFDSWQRSDSADVLHTITQNDVFTVERDRAVMEDIRNRFDWTLDLDDRYKLLAYALVLEDNPSAPRLESDFMALGKGWWPSEFDMMDAQALRAILDEMVGLGVLLLEYDQTTRRYRLRSPNLLRLLGPENAIEEELDRITSQRRVSKANPRNYHPIVDQKPLSFGPLTKEQEGHISSNPHPFQLTIICGSEALGLKKIRKQFERLFKGVGRVGATRSGQYKVWKELNLSGSALLQSEQSLVAHLKKVLARRKRDHKYAVIGLEELIFEGSISSVVGRLLRELSGTCTSESRGHVVLLFDPEQTWEWLNDQSRERVLSNSRVTGIELRRWSDGAIANALDSIGIRTGSKKAGQEVFSNTSGFHFIVNEGLRRARSQGDGSATDLVGTWSDICREWLADEKSDEVLRLLGLRGGHSHLEASVSELLQFLDIDNGSGILGDMSFELAIGELDGEEKRLVSVQAGQIREWLRIMDLARPDGRNPPSMVVAPWLCEVIGVTSS